MESVKRITICPKKINLFNLILQKFLNSFLEFFHIITLTTYFKRKSLKKTLFIQTWVF